MLQPTFRLEAQSLTDITERVIVEPLEQGYGQTLGVSLRRVLLSSIQGAAPVSISIDSVQHQFSTLAGMKEDVAELILNIKLLNFAIDVDQEEVEITCNVKGPIVVTGENLELPAGVRLANPQQHLCELTGTKAKLKFTLKVQKGRGYSMAGERPSTTLGEIPIDAAYSPIVKVAYKIEATRVGRRTDFDKLILDITTDGTISATEAVIKASEILVAHYNQILNPVVVEDEKPVVIVDQIEHESLRLTVEELDLPTRIANALRKGGYATVGDLSSATRDEISKVKNLGGKSVDTVAEALQKKGVSLLD